MQESNYCLIYKDKNTSYSIAYFKKKEEAEEWRDFLAFTMKEYDYDDMIVTDAKRVG